MRDTRNKTDTIAGLTVEPGSAKGQPLVLAEPLSFWGGYNSSSGAIVDPAHPNRGATMRNRILLMTRSKGSSSSSSVLAEAIRNGTGPLAIVMLESDLIVALGAIVARELYGIQVPIVVVDSDAWQRLVKIDSELLVQADALCDATISWSRQPARKHSA